MKQKLLQFDLSASLGELRLKSLSVVLGNAFLNGLRSLVNHSLSFLQAQAGSFLNNLDNVDLVCASRLQNNVELGLLFSSRSSSASAKEISRSSHGTTSQTKPASTMAVMTTPTVASTTPGPMIGFIS